VQELGVVYLCRFAEGEAPVRHFVDVLRRHAPGAPYDLHVVFKGFPDRATLERAHTLFDGLKINPIEVDDRGYDIGSYVKAARAVANRRLIFLNTFSVILGDNWLSHYNAALDLPRAGIVGATGSWQARTTGYEVQARRILRWLLPDGLFRRAQGSQGAGGAQTAGGGRAAPRRPKTFRDFVRYAVAPFAYCYHLLWYPRYPNPHIRTNAFMIERSLFLSLQFPSFAKKEDAYRFESGRQSMTRQIMGNGLRPLVIDRNGAVYDVEEWDASLTFWRRQQENLLIADNRTQDYAEGTDEFRVFLENSAWRHPRSWLNA